MRGNAVAREFVRRDLCKERLDSEKFKLETILINKMNAQTYQSRWLVVI